jgi:hypothetical protein
MFEDDGLWPCKCRECEHEWYSSIAAMRADGEVACPTCGARNSIGLTEFDRALTAARTGCYDFSYLERIPPHFRSGAQVFADRPAPA